MHMLKYVLFIENHTVSAIPSQLIILALVLVVFAAGVLGFHVVRDRSWVRLRLAAPCIRRTIVP
jgi:hypothetical protein